MKIKMSNALSPQQSHHILVDHLEEKADAQTASWYTKYLKGVITYRGLKSGMLRPILLTLLEETGLSQMSEEEQLAHIQYWLAQPKAEDKLTAILWLQFLMKSIPKKERKSERVAPILDLLEGSFTSGIIHDWATNDWLCVRVLELFPQHYPTWNDRLVTWTLAPSLWQRRSGLLAFKKWIKQGKNHHLAEDMFANLLPSDERFVQTAVGWVLSDASRTHPDWAASLFDRYEAELSHEVITRHTKHLSDHQERKARSRKRSR